MRWLLLHVFGGNVLRHPLRALVQVGAIALGVALGYAVHLINTSALAEFSAAVRQVTGQADASIVGPREGFDEAVFERVATDAQVTLASPVLEVDVAILEPARLRGRSLTITGIDALRSGRLGAAWLAEIDKAADKSGGRATRFALFDDGVFLSPAALTQWQLAPGEQLVVQVGTRTQALRIAGRLPGARAGSIAAAMDLGFAQWRLDRLGRLTRIDLQLAARRRRARARRGAGSCRPACSPQRADEAGSARLERVARLSRQPHRARARGDVHRRVPGVLDPLAARSRSAAQQLALLGVLGLTARERSALLLAESALLRRGSAALLGLLLGTALAADALRLLGGDLGGGASAPRIRRSRSMGAARCCSGALGVLAALVGGWLPARDAAARSRRRRRSRAGSGSTARATQRRVAHRCCCSASAARPAAAARRPAARRLRGRSPAADRRHRLHTRRRPRCSRRSRARGRTRPLRAARGRARRGDTATAPTIARRRRRRQPSRLSVALTVMVASFRDVGLATGSTSCCPPTSTCAPRPVASGIASSARFSSADLPDAPASHPGVARVETAARRAPAARSGAAVGRAARATHRSRRPDAQPCR